MTEQIKTLEVFKEIFSGEDTINAFDTAIRSLKAWEEVLNQLHEWKNNAENEHEQKIAYAYFSVIELINQKLEEIEG